MDHKVIKGFFCILARRLPPASLPRRRPNPHSERVLLHKALWRPARRYPTDDREDVEAGGIRKHFREVRWPPPDGGRGARLLGQGLFRSMQGGRHCERIFFYTSIDTKKTNCGALSNKKKEIQRGALARTKALLARRSRRSLLDFAACQSKMNSFLKAAMVIFTFELTKKIEVLSEWPTRVVHLHDVYGDRQAELLKRTAIEGGDMRAARILDSSSQRAAVSRCEEVKKPRNCSISAEKRNLGRAGLPHPRADRGLGFREAISGAGAPRQKAGPTHRAQSA